MSNRVHYLFEMHTMKRFEDATLIAILQKMRTAGGLKLSQSEWQALLNTELDVKQLERASEAFLRSTAGWFEFSYWWSLVSMACYARATISARQAQQMLLFVKSSMSLRNLRASERETSPFTIACLRCQA